ncbi:hypothetical protein Ocin01_10764, partial [Orchesella cincta]
MLCYAPKLRSPTYRSEDRIDLQVRRRSWKEPTMDCIQVGFLGMLELLAPKVLLVKALKEIVESVSIEASLQPEPNPESVQVCLQQEERVHRQDKKAKQGHDVFIYGSDSSRIQYVLYASLKEAKASGIPRITINGATMENGITFIGLRTFLEGKYRALNEPGSVIVLLENCSEDMMLKFEMSGFRDNLRALGIRIAVVVWSCVQRWQTINSNRLALFSSKVFIPSFNEEKPWLDEHGCCKQDVARSACNPKVEETTFSKAPVFPASTVSKPKDFANADVLYTEVTFQGQNQPGPSRAKTALVGQSNGMSSAAVDKGGNSTTPDSSLPSYKTLRARAAAITVTNPMVQDQHPRALQTFTSIDMVR